MSKYQCVKTLGLTPGRIWNLEVRGGCLISAELLEGLSKELGVPVKAFFCEDSIELSKEDAAVFHEALKVGEKYIMACVEQRIKNPYECKSDICKKPDKV